MDPTGDTPWWVELKPRFADEVVGHRPFARGDDAVNIVTLGPLGGGAESSPIGLDTTHGLTGWDQLGDLAQDVLKVVPLTVRTELSRTDEEW